MIKRERELEDMVAKAGLELMNFNKNGAHYQLTLRAPNGATRRFAMAKTPSDVRGDLNQLAVLNRWARENPAPETAMSIAMRTARDPGMPTIVPPNEPKEKTMTPTASKEAALTHIEFYKVCEWLKASSDIVDKPITAAQLAAVASTAVGFKVPEGQLAQCLEAVGVKLVSPSMKTADAIRCVTRELHTLMKQLGHEPSKELAALCMDTTVIEK